MAKPHRIATQAHLDEAIAGLLAADARFHGIAAKAGTIPFRKRREEGFEALMSIITNQQLSVAAADTIYGRLKKAMVPFAPEQMLAASAETLRACSLAALKLMHMKSFAAAILDGSLDLKRVRSMHDE